MPSPRSRSATERAAMLEAAQNLLANIEANRWVLTARARDDVRTRFLDAGAPAAAVDAVLPRLDQTSANEAGTTRQNTLANAALGLTPHVGAEAALGWACVCPQVDGLWPEDALKGWAHQGTYGWLCAAAGISPHEVPGGTPVDTGAMAALAAMRDVRIPSALLPARHAARTWAWLTAAWARSRALLTAQH